MHNDNVIHGPFGSSPRRKHVGQALDEEEARPAGEMLPTPTPEDLQARFDSLVETLRADAQRLTHPGLNPELVSELLSRLAELQALAYKVGRNLNQAMESEEGYISVQADLNDLGSQVQDFTTRVRDFVGEAGLVDITIEQARIRPAPVQHRAFPWGWTFIGLAAVAGFLWLIRNSMTSGTSGLRGLRDARPAP